MNNQAKSDGVILKPGREKPVRQRHPWIFSGAIHALPDAVPDGTIVPVFDSRNNWLAYGLLNRASQIQVRILTWDEEDAIDEDFWRRRLQNAIDLRNAIRIRDHTSGYRLINAENDFLPGLTVDTYDGHLVVQIGALGVEQRKQQLASLLEELTGCQSITERSDTSTRRQEGLSEASGVLGGAAPPERVEIHENGFRFEVDVTHGQKTGFYTDQRDNRRRVADYCEGARVLTRAPSQ